MDQTLLKGFKRKILYHFFKLFPVVFHEIFRKFSTLQQRDQRLFVEILKLKGSKDGLYE